MITTAISAFLGALLTLLVSMLIEYERKPKLSLSIEDPPTDRNYNYADVKDARFVRVLLVNEAMPRIFRWLGREAAMHCSADIQFYHLEDGCAVFASPMPGRWTGSDEPISPQVMPDGKIAMLFDQTKYNTGFHRNSYPGTREGIDVAAKFDADSQCYGWSNWCYIPGNTWRIKDRELLQGRYLVRVTVYSAGEKISELFKLENSASRQHFRLMPTTKQDEALLHSITE